MTCAWMQSGLQWKPNGVLNLRVRSWRVKEMHGNMWSHLNQLQQTHDSLNQRTRRCIWICKICNFALPPHVYMSKNQTLCKTTLPSPTLGGSSVSFARIGSLSSFVETWPADRCIIPRVQTLLRMEGPWTPTTCKNDSTMIIHQVQDSTLLMLPHVKPFRCSWRQKPRWAANRRVCCLLHFRPTGALTVWAVWTCQTGGFIRSFVCTWDDRILHNWGFNCRLVIFILDDYCAGGSWCSLLHDSTAPGFIRQKQLQTNFTQQLFHCSYACSSPVSWIGKAHTERLGMITQLQT